MRARPLFAPLAALLVLTGATFAADLAELERKLHASEERDRRSAVQELGKLGTPEAWTLVLSALRDPVAMVADEAEIQLAKVDAAGLALLTGKDGLRASDTWVRIRCAGALGGVAGPVDPAALLPGLEDKDPELRRTSCASAESLAVRAQLAPDKGAKLAAALDKLRKKDKDAAVRGAALLARARLDGATAAQLAADSAKDDAPEVQCARVRLLAESAAPAELAPFATSPARAVRSTLVRALRSRPSADGAQLLIDLIAAGGPARPAWDAAQVLEEWSGVRGGLDVAIWRGWHAKLGPDWKPSTGSKPAAPTDSGTAVFYGMPVLSDRIAILVDLSGSMWETLPNGRTRKQVVDEELAKTLRGLTPNVRFNLVPYTTTPIPWEKALVPASPQNVERALAWFAACKATGKGSFWEAALTALEDPDVDTLLVLFDGAPSGGRRWNIDLTRERFVERNRFRAVALDALVFGAKRFVYERWEQFAADTGGRALAIQL